MEINPVKMMDSLQIFLKSMLIKKKTKNLSRMGKYLSRATSNAEEAGEAKNIITVTNDDARNIVDAASETGLGPQIGGFAHTKLI